MSAWIVEQQVGTENNWDARRRLGMARLRVQFTNCVFHDHALSPGARPFPEHPALLNAILKTGDKAQFCLLVISRKKKSELIETIQIFRENSSEILAARVPGF